MLCAFISLYSYRKLVKKIKIDGVTLALILILILLSGSRGTYVLLLCYLAVFNALKFSWIFKIKWVKNTIFAFLSVVLLFIGYMFFQNYVVQSLTYSYRFNGLNNYFVFVTKKPFYLFFGCAELLYSGPLNYNQTFKALFGGNSSDEIAYLNVLIKTGMIGMIGFIIIFLRFYNKIKKAKEPIYRIIGLSILVTLILSGFAESYLVNVHFLPGMFCYIILSGVCEMIDTNRVKRNPYYEQNNNALKS